MSKTSENQQYQYMTRRIGSTTYKVRVAFSPDASETLEDKILRMIRNEGSVTGSECGIINAPQVSRPA